MLCEAEPLIDTFGDYVRNFSSQSTVSLEELRTQVEKVYKVTRPGAATAKALDKAVKQLIHVYVCRRLSQRFPMLDRQLFEKKRHILIRNEGSGNAAYERKLVIVESRLQRPETRPEKNEGWAEVPLLASIGMNEKSDAIYHNVLPGRPTWGTIRFQAAFPGEITQSERRYGNLAKAELCRIEADMLECDELVEYMDRSWDNEPELRAHWIPSLESITLSNPKPAPRRDPALILHVRREHFLCCTWDAAEQGEEPLEALVREFSQGGKVNVTRRKKK